MAKVKKFDSKVMFQIFHNNNFDELLEFVNKYGIDSVDRDGRNILHNCIIANKKEWVINLLNRFNDIDLNSQDNSGWSVLHFAVICNNVEILTALLKNESINLEIIDNQGRTPLMNAVTKNYRNEDIIIKLLEAGADINNDNSGARPNEYLLIRVNNYIREKNIKIIFDR